MIGVDSMSNLRYTNGVYDVKHTRYPNKRHFRVQLRTNPDYHTHLRTLKEAIDLANFAKHKVIPDSAGVDYLESLFRVVPDRKMQKKIQRVINSKLGR